MTRICCYCGDTLGEKEGEGVTHGVCPDCLETQQLAIEREMRRRAALRQCRVPANQRTGTYDAE